MTRIFVQRGPGGSSSNSARSGSQALQQQQHQQQNQPAAAAREEELTVQPQPLALLASGDTTEHLLEGGESSSNDPSRLVETVSESSSPVEEGSEREKPPKDDNSATDPPFLMELSGLQLSDQFEQANPVQSGTVPSQITGAASHPPPPPVPPPKPSSSGNNGLSRMGSGSSNGVRIGSSRRPAAWPPVAAWTSASGSRPSSPRSLADCEGYNSADEQGACYTSSYDDSEREHMFEHDLRRVKGFEIRKMAADGNCLFRAVADQVYGDPETYDMARQMCVDYMERERDHFSQFMTEGFTPYCKRKRKDKVYGNNIEIQAFAEMYNRPIHIYSYSTEPINIFQGSYNTDVPPVRLSYHHGNHYNSVVDPRRLTVGAGLGFSSLRGTNSVDRDQVKAAIKAQQDQQIENALLAEGRLYSDLELTEKEIERMVMEASRAEYLNQQQVNFRESSRSGAEPSSSAAISGSSGSAADRGSENCFVLPDTVLTRSMQLLLTMGFSYMQVMEAYSIFGEDMDSMICYLVEMGGTGASASGSNRRKGKAAE
ncbi:OVARIAN TUMOR DOMAIN-containing deubiquitinating enzyme 6-like [Triticum dicoccoides]|uniref:OVARIAN TUMOR DOMAIN-containing deubiquitinating enzyme 6-like n=1 Tax=Triticum dicoccoides TaxID=85692 RepID=UPI000E78D06A|nr:OVARIAN TUMOR DOMAIN-containing deubiquitinating enzyme 6-like [Triticum dicoccoides]XP_037485555.1 OVARIAN TUMOR DOMAIN-containing deubiquitinating enzyme 6-like [Triticum dicoccoides]